jgi:hypothetical protein
LRFSRASGAVATQFEQFTVCRRERLLEGADLLALSTSLVGELPASSRITAVVDSADGTLG